MRSVGRVDIEDIAEENIVSEPLLKQIRSFKENSKLWKYALVAFVATIMVQYGIRFFFKDKFGDAFGETRIGFFLLTLATLFFISFAVFYIREKNILKNKWRCPNCSEGFAFIKSESQGKLQRIQCGRRTFIDDCDRLGIRQAAVEKSPFIVPRRCPNCKEVLWKKDKE